MEKQGDHPDGIFKGPDWHPYVVVDGLLITGQSPASSELAAEKLLGLLKQGAVAA